MERPRSCEAAGPLIVTLLQFQRYYSGAGSSVGVSASGSACGSSAGGSLGGAGESGKSTARSPISTSRPKAATDGPVLSTDVNEYGSLLPTLPSSSVSRNTRSVTRPSIVSNSTDSASTATSILVGSPASSRVGLKPSPSDTSNFLDTTLSMPL